MAGLCFDLGNLGGIHSEGGYLYVRERPGGLAMQCPFLWKHFEWGPNTDSVWRRGYGRNWGGGSGELKDMAIFIMALLRIWGTWVCVLFCCFFLTTYII